MDIQDYRYSRNPLDKQLYNDIVRFGAMKTIYALLDADVDNEVIQRVVIFHWDITQDEFMNFLNNAKKEIALDKLSNYLKLQGCTQSEIDKYISSNIIKAHLSRNHELLAQWKSPEKMLKIIKQLNKK